MRSEAYGTLSLCVCVSVSVRSGTTDINYILILLLLLLHTPIQRCKKVMNKIDQETVKITHKFFL